MIRWEPTDPRRLQPQEMALLALNDRMTTVEQLVTLIETTQRQMIARMTAEQKRVDTELRAEIRDLKDRLRRLEAAMDCR